MDRTLGADLWVYAPRALHKSLGEEFAEVDGVTLVRPAANLPSRLIPRDAGGSEVAIVYTAVYPERLTQVDLLFAPDGGTQEQAIARLAQGGAVLIASPLREWYGIDVGDTVRLQTLQGPTEFVVAGVTLDMTASGYAVVGTWDDAARHFGTDRASIFALHTMPGIEPARDGHTCFSGVWVHRYDGECCRLRRRTPADGRGQAEKREDAEPDVSRVLHGTLS